MTFKNFPLARKLAIGFGAVLGIVALSAVFTVVEVRRVAEIERLTAVSGAAMDSVELVQGDLARAHADVLKLLLTGAGADMANARADLNKLNKDLAAVKNVLTEDAPEFLPGLADYEAKLDSYLRARLGPEIALGEDAGTRPQAIAMVTSGESAPYSAAVTSSYKALHDPIRAWADGWSAAADSAMGQILTVVVGSGILCVLVGFTMAWLIMRAIGRPLSAMTNTMRQLAEGDNTVSIPALDQTDEIGQMAKTVQVFKEAAMAKVRLETEAVETRRLSDGDRTRNEAERAEAAREQFRVVQAVATGLERLSEGDLVFRLNDPFAAEYEKLRADFNGAVQKLQDTMKVVSANTSAIRSGTSEITTASDDLSRRTEQQAASLEETAAALNQITATVKKTSQGSSHAQKVVSSAKADAEHSGDVVRQAVTAMSAIETSSRQISQIIGVIDEIAFQTNLLALNAGVEAARAGDSGRGFAVVASEVRGLAQRSAEAAKEIKTLISASSRQVAEGVELVGETGKALGRIVAQVTDIDGVVSTIAVSTQEQATALQQVNTAINQMDQVTQQNAAMVEQSTAASHSLAQQAQDLAVLIGRFDVGRPGGGVVDAARLPGGGPERKAANVTGKSVTALKVLGRGGAARRAQPDAEEGWSEF